MAANAEGRKVRIQTTLKNSTIRVPVTTVVNEFDSLGPRYRLRDLLSSDKGEDKERYKVADISLHTEDSVMCTVCR